MKGYVFSIAIILMTSIQGISSSAPDSLVTLGNESYNAGSYQQAIDYYQTLLEKGYVSPALYYNLGNSYFKMNEIPSAILYYEKALKLAPKDEDINFNLNLANSRIIDKIEPLPEFFLRKWWKQLIHFMTPDNWARTGVILFISLLFSLTLFIIARAIIIRKTAFWIGLCLLILALFSFYTGFHGYRMLTSEQEGIIFTPTVTVKSSPTDNSVDLFVIHEGTKVRLLDMLEGWTEIRIANGSVGWIKNNDFKPV
jgi:tetratricopeptide (TPR) repeat protein